MVKGIELSIYCEKIFIIIRRTILYERIYETIFQRCT